MNPSPKPETLNPKLRRAKQFPASMKKAAMQMRRLLQSIYTHMYKYIYIYSVYTYTCIHLFICVILFMCLHVYIHMSSVSLRNTMVPNIEILLLGIGFNIHSIVMA